MGALGSYAWECPACSTTVNLPFTGEGTTNAAGEFYVRVHADTEPVRAHIEGHHAEGVAVPGYSVRVDA